MHKILVLTDIHISPQGERIIGLDPGARLERVLERMREAHGDADHLLILGDLVHYGTAEEYGRLRSLLRGVPWPITYLLGNHDDRATFRVTFPRAGVDDAGFVQSRISLPHAHILCLDTLAPEATPRHSGMLCPTRMAWLRTELARAPGTPKIVALHHPPFVTGFDGMDRIGLVNHAEVLDTLRACTDVRLVVAGHIHRTITASIGGLPLCVFKSPCHQMPFQLGPGTSSLSIDEPGAYGLLLIRPDGDIVVHTEDVDVNSGPPLDDPASH
jgi:3',5'-cyclic AMP phosphodiesterase CpdA